MSAARIAVVLVGTIATLLGCACAHAEPRVASSPTAVEGMPVVANAPCPVSDFAAAGPEGAALHAYVDRLARAGAFSGAVLVARGDTVLLHGGYGLADARRGIPVTRATAFDIGSVAKQFAATAVLRLEIEGSLRVDDTLARFFADVPADKRDITLHQLLSHTSGLPGDLETAGARTTGPDDPSLATRLLALPLEFPPGTSFRYSNAGYALIRLVVERASGMPYKRYVAEHLLRPAGLSRTGWHGDAALWAPDDVARGAWGLYDSGSPRDWPLYGATFGGGQMVSTPGDLFRWLKAIDGDAVLDADSRKKLFTPRSRWSGAGAEDRGPGAQYAYGWEVRTRPDGTIGLIFHNGSYDNFRTTVRRFPSDDVVVIVTTNSRQQDAGDRADEVGNALRDILLGSNVELAPETIDVPPAALAACEGVYEISRDARFHVWRSSPCRLCIAPHGQDAFDALWKPDDERSRLNQRIAQRTLELLERLRHAPCDETAQGWTAMFCGLVARFGPLERVELEGVSPLTWSKDWSASVTTLHFARGRVAVTWEWRGEELIKTMSSDDVPEPQSVPLAPVGPMQCVVYDWFTGASVPLAFTAEAGGAPNALVVDTASSSRSVRAVRAR